MRSILFIISLFTALVANAQKVVDVDKTDFMTSRNFYTVAGQPVSSVKYIRVVEGSPFFNENWMPGSLIVAGGKRFDSLFLRLDLVENALQYLDPEGNAMVATNPVTEIWLADSSSHARYHFINWESIIASPSAEKGWYQLLTTGPTILLKGFTKQVSEVTRYGTSVNDQTIATKSKYYLLHDKQLFIIKKTQDIPSLLKDKKEELEKYIQSNRLDNRSEEALISLISYYNSTRAN